MTRKPLTSPTGTPVTLAPVHPNAGITSAYRKKLDALIAEMQRSLVYWLSAQYRETPPRMAEDETPARSLLTEMRELGTKWQDRFDEAAPEMALHFATAATNRTDAAMAATLKKAGFTVKFTMTPQVRDVFQATVGENVGLIRSIASEHLSDVQGAVMRSVQVGGDLSTLSKELEQRYGITKRRAALIARDQNNKATATIMRARQTELGITQAVWLHSAGGRHPRPSHVAFSGKRYDVAKGAFLDGEWTLPGRSINCRCVTKSIILGFDD